MNVDTSTGKGTLTVFDLDSFLSWLDSLDSAPSVFSSWESDTSSFIGQFLGTLADVGAFLTFPIRFIVWLVPVIIDFVSNFLLPGVSF